MLTDLLPDSAGRGGVFGSIRCKFLFTPIASQRREGRREEFGVVTTGVAREEEASGEGGGKM